MIKTFSDGGAVAEPNAPANSTELQAGWLGFC